MLKVTVRTAEEVEIWELEGKLSGNWVGELERCWRNHEKLPVRPSLQVHMKSVSYVDTQGKHLLTEMHGRGVEIRGGGCVTNAVVDEITQKKAAL
jgi:hypothetical protein